MSPIEEARKCEKCGAILPDDDQKNVCHACLMSVGFESDVSVDPTAGIEYEKPLMLDPSDTLENVQPLFPDLELLEIIGHGGMGVVYKARQKHLERLVALKLLRTRLGSDPSFSERFTREARALAKLSHPNIVGVYDFGQAGDRPYLLLEYVDGTNLREMIQKRSLAPKEAIALVPPICEALQFAHEEGIVHRDIKPENILIDRKGRVRIADFGLARITTRSRDEWTLTGTRQVMGTPHYMAPEQVDRPQEVDHRADIFSLGVVIYEMLTGELPIGRFAVPSRKVDIDVRLDEVVLRTLENEPARRYQHVSDVQTDVNRISSTPRRSNFMGKLWPGTWCLPDEILVASQIIDGVVSLWCFIAILFARASGEYVLLGFLHVAFILFIGVARRKIVESDPDRWRKWTTIGMFIPLHYGCLAGVGYFLWSSVRQWMSGDDQFKRPKQQTASAAIQASTFSDLPPSAAQSALSINVADIAKSALNGIEKLGQLLPWKKCFQSIFATLVFCLLCTAISLAAFFSLQSRFLPSQLSLQDSSARRVKLVDAPDYQLYFEASSLHWMYGTQLKTGMLQFDRLQLVLIRSDMIGRPYKSNMPNGERVGLATKQEQYRESYLTINLQNNEYFHKPAWTQSSHWELYPTLGDQVPIQKWLTASGVDPSVAESAAESIYTLIGRLKNREHEATESQGELRIRSIASLLDPDQFQVVESGTLYAHPRVLFEFTILWVVVSIAIAIVGSMGWIWRIFRKKSPAHVLQNTAPNAP